MTGAASIVADLRRAIELFAEIDDPAATRTAEALSRWLAGEDFDSAAGLVPGWRRTLQQQARDTALAALIALRPDLDDSALAAEIATGIDCAPDSGPRPDGLTGHCFDLARAGCNLSARHWRRLVADARGQMKTVLATGALSVWLTSKLES